MMESWTPCQRYAVARLNNGSTHLSHQNIVVLFILKIVHGQYKVFYLYLMLSICLLIVHLNRWQCENPWHPRPKYSDTDERINKRLGRCARNPSESSTSCNTRLSDIQRTSPKKPSWYRIIPSLSPERLKILIN